MTPVLFLHGFLGAPSTFDRVREGLPPSRAIVPLLPGHGRPPRMDLPARFDAVVDALAAMLPEPGLVVGYSMGARLALGLALRHPSRVSGAVLIGVNPGLTGAERAARAAWDDALADAAPEEGIDAFVDAWERQPLFASQRSLPVHLVREERARRTSHTPEGIAWAMRSLGLSRQPDFTPQLADLRVPVTLLAGALDSKFRAIHAAMAARSPAIEARVVEGAGHNLALEAPEAVATALRAQLESLRKERMHP